MWVLVAFLSFYMVFLSLLFLALAIVQKRYIFISLIFCASMTVSCLLSTYMVGEEAISISEKHRNEYIATISKPDAILISEVKRGFGPQRNILWVNVDNNTKYPLFEYKLRVELYSENQKYLTTLRQKIEPLSAKATTAVTIFIPENFDFSDYTVTIEKK